MGSKLNIQPVTKERLMNTKPCYKSSEEMRKNLQTGDIVFITQPFSDTTTIVGVFVSFKDIVEYGYDKLTNIRSKTSLNTDTTN